MIAPGIFYPIFRFLKLLETPSTSLSNSSIVLMNDAYTKEEMHEMMRRCWRREASHLREPRLGGTSSAASEAPRTLLIY